MIQLHQVRKVYSTGAEPFVALDNVSLHVGAGEFLSIVGESGSGKSTLLHILGALDTPTEGRVEIGGLQLQTMTPSELVAFRRSHLGFVFQFFNLLPAMTLLENVALPLLLQGSDVKTSEERAHEQLSHVGLGDKAKRFPHQVSGGEMQRAAVARALVHRPWLLLADEPTGNLDSKTATRVLDILQTTAAQSHATLILVTHSQEAANRAPRSIRVADGRLVEA